MLKISQFDPSDEEKWLKCHFSSYYHSLYFDELVKVKPRYETPTIELIGILNDEIVAILDIEIEQEEGQFCLDDKDLSGMISVIGVSPPYRRKGVATKLLENSLNLLRKDHDVHRLEIWIRDDPDTTKWLKKLNFKEIHSFYQVYLTSDFFDKYAIEFPFGITPIFLTGSMESKEFSELTQLHPPERSFRIFIMEKNF